MGNVESRSDGPLGAVDSLKHRLQSLEETVRSIEVCRRNVENPSEISLMGTSSIVRGTKGRTEFAEKLQGRSGVSIHLADTRRGPGMEYVYVTTQT